MYLDIKTEPKTELEAWERWLNHKETEFRQLPWTPRTKIELIIETENDSVTIERASL